MIGLRAGVCSALVGGFLWLTVPGTSNSASSEPVTMPQELAHAFRSGTDGDLPRTVSLPDMLGARHGDDKTVLMPAYRLHADLGAAPTHTAIYLPGVSRTLGSPSTATWLPTTSATHCRGNLAAPTG